MDVTLPRKDITFVRRPEATTIHVEADDEASSGEDEPEKPMDDSSDPDEISGINDTFFNEEPDHEVKTGKKDSYKKDIMPGWKRDDGFCFDQRSKVSTSKDPPKLNLPQEQVNEKSFFELGCLFLPMLFLELMAAAMTTQGRVKHDQGDVHFSANWTVTTNDLLQWIGVWMYMLAFPQPGGRRVYWEEPNGGFGPRHKLQAWLRLGDNGEKGVRWFENMLLCFTLPGYTRGDKEWKKDDPFQLTRRFWDALRDAFYQAVTASWLLVLDESMVQWQGRGMPGLMVILRKPTPIGLELHTLCCALCGILVWFEVYEGKEAMATKEFCNEYGKSIALTLRMCKKFFGTARVLVADSWFGSVACAIALHTKGIFAVMNVKTATTNYPKDELMEEVGEIKGKSAEAKKQRRERRGKQVAFTQEVEVGGDRKVTLLAAGNNKKVPLLLICTAFTMLPGEEHNKVWKVNQADGSVELHSLKTEQPEVHALYRLFMNVVDIHNKLRQGVVSMADVWATTAWDKRHFAEGLGFWEVNVYKAFCYFVQTGTKVKMGHGEFRQRLAWAFMTLGKVPYPADAASTSTAAFVTPGASLPDAPLPGGTHKYVPTPGTSGKTCAYCGNKAYQKCQTCEDLLGCPYPVCGAKSARKHECMEKHRNGEPCLHTSFTIGSPGKRAMKAAWEGRKRDTDAFDGDDEDDFEDDPSAPPTSPADGTRANKKRAKKARQEKKAADKAEAEAQATAAGQAAGRAARQAKRGIAKE
uniref:PiggyBac transposable element-derived protein domain-containing protein n=1 Tax=Haptolina ericina TaxID=156174 RepID=A0A7S3AX02_9EUKA|mmetsp:Transcript_40336/g.91355  ORF Transcript_40336/g.91355 Transcript_40336/m.91355 type:complete len:752 (+) Transcript_40336:296-2551(+)